MDSSLLASELCASIAYEHTARLPDRVYVYETTMYVTHPEGRFVIDRRAEREYDDFKEHYEYEKNQIEWFSDSNKFVVVGVYTRRYWPLLGPEYDLD